jgi:hypothetical protein
VLVEQPAEPTDGVARVPRRILLCDKGGELERLGERDLAELAGHPFGEDQVPVLDRPPKDRPRMPLRGHSPPAGAGRLSEPNRHLRTTQRNKRSVTGDAAA